MTTSVGGWTCPSCHGWVPTGSIHHCPGVIFTPVADAAPGGPPVVVDPTLVLALAVNRLAEALEGLTATIQLEKEEGEEPA